MIKLGFSIGEYLEGFLVASSATVSKPNFMAGDDCNWKKKDLILPAQEHTTPLGAALKTGYKAFNR